MKAFHLAWIRFAVCLFCSSAAFLPADCRSAESSLGTRRPVIRKLGTIDCDLVETTPLVFRNTLYRFEWVRASYRKNTLQKDHFRVVEHDTGGSTPPFALDYQFGSAFVDNGVVYVTGTFKSSKGDHIRMFKSQDMRHWDSWIVFSQPGFGIFNTSLCKAGPKYE